MGVFTRLGPAELGEVAQAFSLGVVQSFDPIAAGTINSNYSLETSRGRWFVRVNEGKAEVDVAWEARLVEALAAGGVATPAPMCALDGRSYAPLANTRKWVSVFPWRGGRHLAADEVTHDHAAELGAALAQLHRVGLELPTAWRRGSIYDQTHLVTRFQRIAASVDPALAHAIAIVGDELARLAGEGAIRRRAPQGIIHGDLFRDNVLWQGIRLVAILDFEQASGGSLAYDLAVAINDWAWASGPRPEVVRALIDGYERVRPMTTGDRAALPVELRAAAARFTVTRITDVYLPGIANPHKDFRDFLARVSHWRASGA